MVGPLLLVRSARAAAPLWVTALLLAACPGPPVNVNDAGQVGTPVLFYDAGDVSAGDGGPGGPEGDAGAPSDGGPGDTGLVGIEAVTAPSGPLAGGNRVRLEGFGFTPPPDTRVFFNGREAENVLYLDDRRITAFVPAGENAGPALVRVENSFGVTQASNVYTYFSPVKLLGLDPDVGSAAGGTFVTLAGDSLNDDMIVLVDGRQVVQLEVAEDGASATFLMPPGRSGRVDVEALDTFGRSVLPLSFTYENALEVRSVAPAAALPGAYVDVRGAGFAAGALARIGGLLAVLESLVHEGRLYVQVPPALATGLHDVEVFVGGQVAVLQDGFFALPPANAGTLAILGAVPSVGDVAGGTLVHLAGDGFTGTTGVLVGGAAASFEVLSDRLLAVTVPAGSVGQADVVVQTDDLGEATFTGFSYAALLALTNLDPAGGPAAGGTPLVLTGRGFAAGMSATLGGVPLTDLVVVSATEATATAPAGATGPVDLVVRLDDERARLVGAFVYEAELKLLGVHPVRGGMSGNTFVTLRGQGFTRGGAASVRFGQQAASSIEVVSDSILTARTPMQAPGVVDVSVAFGEERATAFGAFSYFDPTILVGGTRGGAIDGAVYLTALDAFLGLPIPNLVVFLGTDGDGQHMATTNMLGQATVSGPDVRGPQTVSVIGDGWEYATLVDVNAAEITLYLQPLTSAPPDDGPPPPPPPPPATLRGKVFGFAKEFFDPAALGPDEIAVAFVVTTARDEFSRTPNPGGQNVVFQEGGEYFIANSRTGRLAVVALAGIFNLETGQLRLRQMGVRRAVYPQRGVDLLDQDIELTIRLDEEIDLSLPDAPLGQAGGPTVTRVVPFLRFGGEGALAYTDAVATTRNHFLKTMPKVPGEMLTFIAGAYTTNGQGLITEVGTLDLVAGEAFAFGTGTTWLAANPFTGQPRVNGGILVVERANGERWASTVASAMGNGTLLLDSKPPFSESGMRYHVGSPTYPSSIVRQSASGDLIGGVTIAPVLGMPEPLSPLASGVLEQRTLRWKPAAGQAPTNHLAYVYDPFNFAVLWTFYLDGSRTKAPIPRMPAGVRQLDLGDNAPPKDMPLGMFAWQHMSMYAPGFDYENFSYMDIGSRARRSWTTDALFFTYGGD
jgi:hypothetical protein